MIGWILSIILLFFIVDMFILKPGRKSYKNQTLTENLFRPDLRKEIQIPTFPQGRGIVTYVDNDMIMTTALSLIALRMHGCHLPILSFTSPDLTEENRRLLTKIGSLALQPEMDPSVVTMAILRSPFKEIVFLGSGMTLLQNPEHLFSSGEYRSTGTVFWKDKCVDKKTFQDQRIWEWVRQFIPYEKEDNRILGRQSSSFQSGAIFCINKSAHRGMLEKLVILERNWKDNLCEDKEYPWLAAELAREPYSFVPAYPGVIGTSTCGSILHFDAARMPLGFENGNVDITLFDQFSSFDLVSKWNLTGILNRQNCLIGGSVTKLTPEMKNLLNEYSKVLHNLRMSVYATNN